MRPAVVPKRVRVPIRSVAAGLAVALLLTACGGGGGNGGGDGDADYVLRVLVVNAHSEPHTLSYSGGAPLPENVDPETVESCAAIIVLYPVVIPFELLVDGVPVIVSDELALPVPEGTDLIARINIEEDGTAVPDPGDTSRPTPVTAGRNVNKPAAVGICT